MYDNMWPERAKSLELWSLTQITHVLSVADSSRPRLDFSAISTHTRLMLELLKTDAVVIIACDGRLSEKTQIAGLLYIQEI
jgi:hypothetical protein